MHLLTKSCVILTLFATGTISETVIVEVNPETVTFSPPNAWVNTPITENRYCGWWTNTPNATVTFHFRGSSISFIGDFINDPSISNGTGSPLGDIYTTQNGFCNETIPPRDGFNASVDTDYPIYYNNPGPEWKLAFKYYVYERPDPTTPASGNDSTTTSVLSSPLEGPTSTTPTTNVPPNSTSILIPSTDNEGSTSSPSPGHDTTSTTTTDDSPTQSSDSVQSSLPPSSTPSAGGPALNTSTFAPAPQPSPSILPAPPSKPSSTPDVTSERLCEASTTNTTPSTVSLDDPQVFTSVLSTTLSSASSAESATSSVFFPVPRYSKPSLISGSSPNEATPTSSMTNITNETNHPSNSQHKTAVIVGSAIGGLAATGLLLAAAHAFTNPAWIGYVLISISTAFGLGATFHTRRLIIRWKKGLKLPLSDIKIALFITAAKSKSDPFSLDGRVIVWQTSFVNAQHESFNVDIPCRGKKTRLCFGTYSDDSQRITVEAYEEAPAVVEDDQGGSVRWRRTRLDSSVAGVEVPVTAENKRSVPTSIVVGTRNNSSSEDVEKDVRMIPFLRIPEENFQPSQTYELKEKLYLHAFRVTSDCQLGQIGNTVPNSARFLQDELTKLNPIEIDTLLPLTTWHITPKKDGGLSLKLAPTKKKDKKKYNHECTIDPKARREDDQQALVGGEGAV